jgi:subtilisin family serine protease
MMFFPAGAQESKIQKIVLPKIIFNKNTYSDSDTIIITITDKKANTNLKIKDQLKFLLSSSKYPKGVLLTATEIEPNSGTFRFSLKATNIASKDGIISASLTGSFSEIKTTANIVFISKPETKIIPESITEKKEIRKEEPVKVPTKKTTTPVKKLVQPVKKTADFIKKIKEKESYFRKMLDSIDGKDKYVLKKDSDDFKKILEIRNEIEKEHTTFVYKTLTEPIEPTVVKVITKFTELQKPTKTPSTKIDSKIYDLIRTQDKPQYAISKLLEVENGKTRLLVELNNDNAEFLNKVNDSGWIEWQVGNQFQLSIPIDEIENLSDMDSVSNVRPLTSPLQHSRVVSEGVEMIKADLVQESGISGRDVRIAILDLAFDAENPEISENVAEKKSFRKSFGRLVPVIGTGQEYVHGTAVAEIITDVAPDVKLYLYTIGTEIEFVQAIDYALSKDVDIIEMSAGWLNYPTDGSSSMTRKLEDVVSRGKIVVLSSGNYAQSHWEGRFVDQNNNGWHEFIGQDEGLTLEVTEEGFPIIVYLLWNSQDDFDVILTDSHGQTVDESTNRNLDSGYRVETIQFLPESTGTYHVGISKSSSGGSNTELEIFSPTHLFEYSVSSSSVGVPTDAEGAIVTGAIYYVDSSLEPFSSRGPANNGRSVPNLVGPDGVSTLAYGEGFPFYGTSAAAPYVAGVAALVMEEDSTISPAQIARKIQDHAARNLLSVGANYNMVGNGRVDASFIIESHDTRGVIPDRSAGSGATQGSIDNGLQRVQPEDELEIKKMDIPKKDALTVKKIQKEKLVIPGWIKTQASWWHSGVISDNDFINSIEYLIKNEIISIPNLPESGQKTKSEIPYWIKKNAKWWSDGLITDNDFAKGIEFLIQSGIIALR